MQGLIKQLLSQCLKVLPYPSKKQDEAFSSSLGAVSRAVNEELQKSGVSKKSAKSDAEKQAKEAEKQRKKEQERVRNSIISGWNDTGATVERAQQAQQRAKNAVSNLGKVRDQVVSSLDNLRQRKQDAIFVNVRGCFLFAHKILAWHI